MKNHRGIGEETKEKIVGSDMNQLMHQSQPYLLIIGNCICEDDGWLSKAIGKRRNSSVTAVKTYLFSDMKLSLQSG